MSVYIHAYTHTYIHTYTHTYTYIYIYIYIYSLPQMQTCVALTEVPQKTFVLQYVLFAAHISPQIP